MRTWNLALVPLFAAATFVLLRAGDPPTGEAPGGRAAPPARNNIGTLPPAGGDQRPPRSATVVKPTLSTARPPANPVVNLQAFSEMERAIIDAPGPERGPLSTTLDIVNRRLTKLIKNAAEVCEAQELQAPAGARAAQAAQDRTESQVQVSASVESGGNAIRLSKITVTTWRGAALTTSFEACLESFARTHAGDPGLTTEPAEATFPAFTGTHQQVVGLQTACSAPVRP